MATCPQAFFDAYVTCALWSSLDDETPLDANHGHEDIAPKTLDKMLADCNAFWMANEPTRAMTFG